MPSVGHVALGKQPVTGNSRPGRLFLPSAKGGHSAKGFFRLGLPSDIRGALGKWLFPVPRGRARCITAPLPSVSNGHSAKTPICRVPTAQHSAKWLIGRVSVEALGENSKKLSLQVPKFFPLFSYDMKHYILKFGIFFIIFCIFS